MLSVLEIISKLWQWLVGEKQKPSRDEDEDDDQDDEDDEDDYTHL